ncbi:rhodanese-like domain-containing protein [Agrobacterium rosae]|uniref:Rhodanese-like domain-containing protein n=1 Tax=Agrobacterium rosae TaxID=1972867 RepID=A0AAE5VND7_9HYPH|nr:rhodanese-like domain-containing protein [Agrobacterium rosae]KAA3515643.1 thiosulfate sulfurtransferase [Agrobacterium rosae]KAA3524604.1 thiosulfate sulfurtransferase [Agrobacterium rosae]MCM2431540.1 thiosulfate sulfurtransferase [Agrobacterium rosae]MDX8328794.1 rhodanese-like domain-containing protein [Agrobacterium rosae]MQB46989.1 thiosulfate sulfurtransferase [Agrobacterium rosae]
MSEQSVSKNTLINWLGDGEELAVIDIRPVDDVGYASPLFATNLPADRLDAELDRFVPRRSVRTVLVDDGTEVARQSAERLKAKGWSNIHFLDGGLPAWIKGGLENLPTFDIPGVPFVQKVRAEKNTPVVFARELKAWKEAGEDVVVIDTRTTPEYEKAHVPSAVNVPGAELLLRFADLVTSTETKIVVSCAGLPRAILGAQTLIDAGIENRVSYLHDGTRGWTDDGFDLETGLFDIYRPASAEAKRFAQARLETFSKEDDLVFIDRSTTERWLADKERTTYFLDVRTPEEFAASHIPGSISSEGGQLLGVAYRTIAVRGARVILVDDLLGARARVVAHWLKRRGFEIAIHLHDFEQAAQVAA